MEQDYGINVTDEDAENIHTVGDAIDFANRRLAEA
jgi:acyl carrier protein